MLDPAIFFGTLIPVVIAGIGIFMYFMNKENKKNEEKNFRLVNGFRRRNNEVPFNSIEEGRAVTTNNSNISGIVYAHSFKK